MNMNHPRAYLGKHPSAYMGMDIIMLQKILLRRKSDLVYGLYGSRLGWMDVILLLLFLYMLLVLLLLLNIYNSDGYGCDK